MLACSSEVAAVRGVWSSMSIASVSNLVNQIIVVSLGLESIFVARDIGTQRIEDQSQESDLT